MSNILRNSSYLVWLKLMTSVDKRSSCLSIILLYGKISSIEDLNNSVFGLHFVRIEIIIKILNFGIKGTKEFLLDANSSLLFFFRCLKDNLQRGKVTSSLALTLSVPTLRSRFYVSGDACTPLMLGGHLRASQVTTWGIISMDDTMPMRRSLTLRKLGYWAFMGWSDCGLLRTSVACSIRLLT